MTTMTAAQVRTHTGAMEQVSDPEVPERPRPPGCTWLPASCGSWRSTSSSTRPARGALRREDLYTSLLSEWRKQREKGALAALGRRSPAPPRPPSLAPRPQPRAVGRRAIDPPGRPAYAEDGLDMCHVRVVPDAQIELGAGEVPSAGAATYA
jgi:transposase